MQMTYIEPHWLLSDNPQFTIPGWSYNAKVKAWVTTCPLAAKRMQHYADEGANLALVAATAEATRVLTNSQARDANLQIPHPPGHAYRPFQRAGIAYAHDMKRSLNGDDPGLGKTIQTIGLINLEPKINRALIVTFAFLKENWRRECQKWLTRSLSYQVATPGFFPTMADIVIINYDLLKKYLGHIHRYRWDLLVGDEIHACKNPGAVRSRAFYSIPSEYALGLTGTPIVNKIDDLFPVIHWLNPEAFPSKRGFTRDYKDRHEPLQQRLRTTVMIRRLKSEVLDDLPAKTRQIIPLPKAGLEAIIERELKEWRTHEIVHQQLRDAMKQAKEVNDTEAYKEAVKNFRATVAASLSDMAKLRKRTALAKLPYVVEHVSNLLEQEDKVICFAYHHEVIETLAKSWPGECVCHYGCIDVAQRDIAITQFCEDPRIKLLIASIATAVGYNAQVASIMCFAELDYTPSRIDQAESRCHRMGMKHPLLIQHLVLEDSLDERMAQILVRKQEISEESLNAQKLTPDSQASNQPKELRV